MTCRTSAYTFASPFKLNVVVLRNFQEGLAGEGGGCLGGGPFYPGYRQVFCGALVGPGIDVEVCWGFGVGPGLEWGLEWGWL